MTGELENADKELTELSEKLDRRYCSATKDNGNGNIVVVFADEGSMTKLQQAAIKALQELEK